MDSFLDALALGLLGGAHCLGMCGVFSAAVGSACRGSARLRFAGRLSAYLGGKTLTYAFLGAAAATLGGRWLEGAHLHEWRRVALALAALTIFLTGLQLGGWLPSLPVGTRGNALWRAIEAPLRSLRRAMALPGASGAAVLGFLNGFLPCGLVYAAVLLAAATGSALRGAAVMVVFGVATAPALLLPALAGRVLSSSALVGWRRLAATCLLVLALLTAWRGLASTTSGAACCAGEERANLPLAHPDRASNLPPATPSESSETVLPH